MNDFDNLLSSSDFGFKPQGKSAPMKPSSASTSSRSTSVADPPKFDDFGDIFGGSAKFGAKSENRSSVDIDSMFSGGASKHSSLPVFDKPVYDDDDIFEGVPGLKSSASAKFDDFNVFSSSSMREKKKEDVEEGVGGFDDLLGGLGTKESGLGRKGSGNLPKGSADFDDLLPGFGVRSSPLERYLLGL